MDNPAVVQTEERDGYLWVKMPESLGMENAREILQEIKAALPDTIHDIALDLTETQYIYSSGISMLINLRKQVAARGGSVCLINISRKCRALLESLHLEKVFPMFATDVEFEISYDEVWDRTMATRRTEFIFVAQVEEHRYRVYLSGYMTASHDLNPFRDFDFEETVKTFLFDLSGLDVVDTYGAQVFLSRLRELRHEGCTCIAFGGSQTIVELLQMLLDKDLLVYCDDEKSALERAGVGE